MFGSIKLEALLAADAPEKSYYHSIPLAEMTNNFAGFCVWCNYVKNNTNFDVSNEGPSSTTLTPNMH
jgi:hypothetical protein